MNNVFLSIRSETTLSSSVSSRGHTLVELIIVIIVIATLSAAVMASINAKTKHSVTAQADRFRRDLSHIQLLAISRASRLKLTVTSTGYSVVSCTTSACTTTATLTDPATGQSFSVTLTDGVTFTAPASLPATLYFDSLGRPTGTSALNTSTVTYTLSASSRSVNVTVLPLTGFAQTTY